MSGWAGRGPFEHALRTLFAKPLAAAAFLTCNGLILLGGERLRQRATMVGGLLRGLHHEDAARFSFLLATPIVLAAGMCKLPDLLGPLGNGIRGQVLAGSLVAWWPG
jgi:undecaprenyl-diphosphatase